MALTINISKVSVSKQMEGLWNITLNLKCDDTTEVINQDFSIRYRTGQDITEVINKIQNKMQKCINDYKSERQIFNHQKLDDAIVTLQENLIG